MVLVIKYRGITVSKCAESKCTFRSYDLEFLFVNVSGNAINEFLSKRKPLDALEKGE